MLLPARTVKYIEALNREGDEFRLFEVASKGPGGRGDTGEIRYSPHHFGRTHPTRRRQSNRYAGSASCV